MMLDGAVVRLERSMNTPDVDGDLVVADTSRVFDKSFRILRQESFKL